MMELNIKGHIVLIDEEDYERVIMHTWHIGNQGYPVNSKMQKHLHQFLLGNKDGFIIDHINRDNLDNQKNNLRHTTYTVNNQNREFKGYTWDKSRNRWKVMITLNGKRHQRRFKEEKDAIEYAEQIKKTLRMTEA